MTNGHIAFFASIAGIVPVLFLALAVDARRRSDSIAAHRTVPVPSLRVTAVYELVAVIALAATEVIALHAIYRGGGTPSATATVVVLLAYAGYIIAAPWLTRAIRSTWGHPEPSLSLIAWTMTLGGAVALVVALIVIGTTHVAWWVILLPAVPLAIAAIFISAGRRSRLGRLVPQGVDEPAG